MVPSLFPTMNGRDLEGKEVVIPRDFTGAPNLLLVAFKRWHQILVDSWGNCLSDLQKGHAGLEVWEVPTLSSGYKPFRSFIDGGMRAGIPSPQTRRHTLTVYTSLHDIGQKLALPDFETIHLYLLGADGSILWTGSGEYDDVQAGALAQALEGSITEGSR
jgi:hypothetical protein